MNAIDVIQQIEKLSSQEQEKVFTFLTDKVIRSRGTEPNRWLEKKLSFDEACDVAFRFL
jgi:hypothetical protein